MRALIIFFFSMIYSYFAMNTRNIIPGPVRGYQTITDVHVVNNSSTFNSLENCHMGDIIPGPVIMN